MTYLSKKPREASFKKIKEQCLIVRQYMEECEHNEIGFIVNEGDIEFNLILKAFPLWLVILATIRITPQIFMKWARWILIERWDKREIPEGRKQYEIFKGIPDIR